MNSKERNFLRKRAHGLEPVVRVGKEGVTDTVIQSIKEYIEKNELMKVKLLQNSLEDVTMELVNEIEAKAKCVFVGSVGKIMIFFKEKRDKNKIGEITQEFIEFKKKRREMNE
ncbi:YhbY family RNA-binding protein [Streptobacillus felis]|uniref:YhbY family RNA-binding protein n=1 Tax=Streptobacillus felis TaxID=1384509 RepID=A0A7Z0PEP1_9FUSO|nr:YhbY family RNA-binding protein [Streptobacillus felis]NYV27348.1 YhbY family RNA-binding protein [Streptobacillus felis]